jgi:hypothetical protein
MSQGDKNVQPDRAWNPGPSEYHTAVLPTEISGLLHIFSPKKVNSTVLIKIEKKNKKKQWDSSSKICKHLVKDGTKI